MRKVVKEGHQYEYLYECEDGDIIQNGRKFKKGTGYCPPLYEDELYNEDPFYDEMLVLNSTTFI